MSDFEEDRAEYLRHKYILESFKMTQTSKEICDYMSDYIGAYYKDALLLERLQVGLDLAETIVTLQNYISTLTPEQLQQKHIHEAEKVKVAPEWYQEEYMNRIDMVVPDGNYDRQPTMWESTTVYLFSQLPILEPLNES